MSQSSYPDSWWAASTRHRCDFPALSGDAETDVVIMGGGFTGLAAAHHLQDAGHSCIVLDANRVGWGASGRNGGIAVPRYKLTYPELEQKYGIETAVLLYRAAHDALDTLEAIVDDHRLECDFSRSGHITPVVSAADVSRFSQDVEWLKQKVGDTAPSMFDAGQLVQRLGTRFYKAGYYEPRGATIHPLEYCQTLANALASKGVRIFCDTRVIQWESAGEGVVVQTLGGRVKARKLLLAANAYSNISAAGRCVEKRVVPVASAVIATEPLPAALRAQVLSGGQAATDAKRLTNYYRVLRDGSFFFGGRGGASSDASQRIYDRLRRDMIAIFPELASIEVRHQWFGLVAVTLDSLPHIGSVGSNVHFAMGYNGRGVALAALLGKHLANACDGRPAALGPISDSLFKPIPFHFLRRPAKQVAIAWKQFLDSVVT